MLKVLIVDDEVFVRGGLRTMINWTDHGFKVVGDAADGEKALKLALETKPDLVLTDLVMPHMNGLELIRELNSKLPETKVIVLSCHNDYAFVREAMQMKNVLDYSSVLSALIANHFREKYMVSADDLDQPDAETTDEYWHEVREWEEAFKQDGND